MRLVLDNVTVGYTHPVIRGLSLEISNHGLVLVLGPNGAGKTTLLRTIAGLLKPWSGRVLINDLDVSGHPELAGRFVGYVPQINPSKHVHPITPIEYLETLVKLRLGKKRRDIVERALELVELPREKWFANLWSLSGGERQRVFIAQALALDPPILLLDEPFTYVDPVGKKSIARLIASLRHRKIIVVTSHDPTLLLPYADLVVLLSRSGRHVVGKPNEVFRREVLLEIYGDSFVEYPSHMHMLDHHVG